MPKVKPAAAVTTPTAVINRRAAARLRHGHVWVYRSDLVSEPPAEPGSLVSVGDEQRNLVGTALYSSSSQIALRMISSGPVSAEAWLEMLRDRLGSAIAYRRRLLESAPDTTACRLVFSEADFLPGLIIDRYHDVLSMQVLAQAMDAPAVREVIAETLKEELCGRGGTGHRPVPHELSLVERIEPRIRELEQLPPRDTGAIFGEKTTTVYSLNGVKFHYDAAAGQKTGAFLDQRENYAAAERHARGDALDTFTYQGGFALHLARACNSVTAVDSSRPALEVADQNAALNQREVEWIEANVFDLLKDYASAGKQYDTVVLDPPAFAKSKKDLGSALRGYKELNLRALKMLRPGGVLVTCSCSYHVSEGEFLEMLQSAAADARRSPRVLEKRGQAQDHPVLLTVPETSYLKCLILQV
ncbi:MAG TPA: class I SAM-dependent rRNA methyltransferase [Terriglobales bacterium]|nr:class I SAM-dependent rRNA methyltransferase [Terriglobales bacterium]